MGHYLDLIQEPAKTIAAMIIVGLLAIGGLWGDLLVARLRKRGRKS